MVVMLNSGQQQAMPCNTCPCIAYVCAGTWPAAAVQQLAAQLGQPWSWHFCCADWAVDASASSCKGFKVSGLMLCQQTTHMSNSHTQTHPAILQHGCTRSCAFSSHQQFSGMTGLCKSIPFFERLQPCHAARIACTSSLEASLLLVLPVAAFCLVYLS